MTVARRATWTVMSAVALILAAGAARAENGHGVSVEVMPSSANSAASVATPSKEPASPATHPTGPFEKQAIRRSGGAGSSSPSSSVATSQPSSSSASAAYGGWDLGNVPIALAAVIVVILILRWMAKGIVPGGSAKNSSRAVQVIGRSIVSPKQQLLVVQFGRRLVLVGSAGGGEMNAISQIDDPDEVAELLAQLKQDKAPSPAAKNFAAMFGRAGSRYEEPEPVEAKADEGEAPADGDDLSGLMDRVRNMSRQFEKA